MDTPKLTLSLLPEKFGICRLDENTPIPEWAKEESSLTSITVTDGELSIVCPQEKIPGGVMYEKDWRAFKLETVLDISSVGIVASLSKPLADEKISIFYISTYETNYLLVEDKEVEKSKKVLGKFCVIK
ncbi:MAG: ACT domain-containing protein [bacterium]|nr:ACT domain-containing protein [bacterium]